MKSAILVCAAATAAFCAPAACSAAIDWRQAEARWQWLDEKTVGLMSCTSMPTSCQQPGIQ